MRSFASYSNLIEIGRGGMARVYRANSPTGHLVALKILSLHLATDKSALLRFKQESNLGMQHPNIVRVIESGIEKDHGEPYIVMDYVPSESLEQRLTRVKRLPPVDVARIVTDVARALDYAHEKGIVHRDVKPGNILLRTSNDQALLTDFGIAKTPFATAYTATIARVGSVLYMSPEQADGTPSLTRASDIYSLAVTAYYALSGRHPFESSDPIVVARQHIDARPPHVCDQFPNIPRTVGDVVMQALTKQPHQRPPTAGRFARLLSNAAQGKGIDDPMQRITTTVLMPPRHGGGMSATVPTASSRTAQMQMQMPPDHPSKPATAQTASTRSNVNSPRSTESSRQWTPWLLGGIVVVLAIILVALMMNENVQSISKPISVTPKPRQAERAVATSTSAPAVVVIMQASATVAPIIPSSRAIATPIIAWTPVRPLPMPRPSAIMVTVPPTLVSLPTNPPQPTPTILGVLTPIVVPSDTPLPPDTPVPSDTPLPEITATPTEVAIPMTPP